MIQTTFQADHPDIDLSYMPSGHTPHRMLLFKLVYIASSFAHLEEVHGYFENDLAHICDDNDCSVVFTEPRIEYGSGDSFQLDYWCWMPSAVTEAQWRGTETYDHDPRFERFYSQTHRDA